MAKKQQPIKKSKSKSVSKKVIAKKTAPKIERIKDEKKVKAGKVRQSTGIKDSKGRFVSQIFTNEVKRFILASKKFDVANINADQTEKFNQLLKEAKITPKDLKKYYEKNKEIFEDLKLFGKLKGTSKNSNQIDKAIDNYKGKILINDGSGPKQVTKEEAKYLFAHFKQILKSNINVVEFYVRPIFTTDGTITINLPEPKKFKQLLKKKFGLKNLKELESIESADISIAIKEILEELYGEESDIFIIIS